MGKHMVPKTEKQLAASRENVKIARAASAALPRTEKQTKALAAARKNGALKTRIFSEEQIYLICSLYVAGMSLDKLSVMFGCAYSTVQKIVNRKTYAEIDA